MIDDDIYNWIIEFKEKNEIIEVKRNYDSNAEKRIWTDKYVHEHHAYDNNNAGYVNVESFHNWSGAIVNWEKVWTNSCVQMYKLL